MFFHTSHSASFRPQTRHLPPPADVLGAALGVWVGGWGAVTPTCASVDAHPLDLSSGTTPSPALGILAVRTPQGYTWENGLQIEIIMK